MPAKATLEPATELEPDVLDPVPPDANIYQRMLWVAQHVSSVTKDTNVMGRYRAVSHDAVVAAVRPLLLHAGILMVTDVVEHTLTTYERIKNERIEGIIFCSQVRCRVSFINAASPQDRVDLSAFGMGMDDQDKSFGKAVSYAKKYALLIALLLGTGDDEEARQPGAIRPPQPNQAPPPQRETESRRSTPPPPGKQQDWRDRPISPAQAKRLFAIAGKAGWSDEEVKELVRLKRGCSVSELPVADYDGAVEYVQEKGPETLTELRVAAVFADGLDGDDPIDHGRGY